MGRGQLRYGRRWRRKAPKGLGKKGFVRSSPFSDISFAGHSCYVRLCLCVLCAHGWRWGGSGGGRGEEGKKRKGKAVFRDRKEEGGRKEGREEAEKRGRREGEGAGRKGERQQQQLGLSKAVRGSSVSCAELEIWDVEWTGAARPGLVCLCVCSMHNAHALSRAPCARHCFSPPTGIIQ